MPRSSRGLIGANLSVKALFAAYFARFQTASTTTPCPIVDTEFVYFKAGQAVTLYLAEYEYNKEKKFGIRLKLPADATKPAAKEGTIIPPQRGDGTARSASRKADMDDEIPF